jgi:hypothetical protein
LENISKEAKLEEQSWRFKRIHYYTSVDLLLLHSMKLKSLFYLFLPTHAANEKGANQIKHKKNLSSNKTNSNLWITFYFETKS